MPGNELPRRTDEVLLEGPVKAALIRLNPEIEADPAKADEVIYKLRAILIAARTSPHPVVANEEFMAWLTGQKSMPFGPNGEHTTVRLIDFDHPEDDSSNQWMISTEVTFKQGRVEKRFDLVLWCNGFPLVVGEAKTPVRPAYTWIDGAAQIHDDYEQSVPQFFVPNVFSFATEGKDFRYGTVGMPVELWGPWREETTDADAPAKIGLAAVSEAVEGVLKPAAVLDFLRFFTIYATDKKHRKIKIIARFQQFQATNLIVERVLLGKVKQGLIWHFQGSGKSLLMVFTALKLRAMAGTDQPNDPDRGRPHRPRHPDHRHFQRLRRPRTGVDRLTRATADAAAARAHARSSSRRSTSSARPPGVLDARHNIIAMVDEAHRTQEGDYGQQDARGAAERIPVRPDRHADQQARPQHVHVVRLRPRTTAATCRATPSKTRSATARRCHCISSRACRRSTSTRTPSTPPSRNSRPSAMTSPRATRSRCRRRPPRSRC